MQSLNGDDEDLDRRQRRQRLADRWLVGRCTALYSFSTDPDVEALRDAAKFIREGERITMTSMREACIAREHSWAVVAHLQI